MRKTKLIFFKTLLTLDLAFTLNVFGGVSSIMARIHHRKFILCSSCTEKMRAFSKCFLKSYPLGRLRHWLMWSWQVE